MKMCQLSVAKFGRLETKFATITQLKNFLHKRTCGHKWVNSCTSVSCYWSHVLTFGYETIYRVPGFKRTMTDLSSGLRFF